MHFDDPLGDGQTKAGAALGLGMRALRLLEFFEYFGLVGFGYAWSGILDCDRVTAIGRRSLHRHLAAVGEFDRIADQIEQYLRKAPFVAARGR
jgi:hypothetical protein